jgi:penicillin-binding protein 2
LRNIYAIKDHFKESRLYHSRTIIATVVIILLFSVLIGRLIFLQVSQHDLYKTLSLNNQVRIVPIVPQRGLIFDRHGILLAENRPAFSLTIIPERVPDIPLMLDQIDAIIKLTRQERLQFLKQLKYKRTSEGIPLRFNLSEQEVAKISVGKHRLPGVEIIAQLVRHYPRGEAFAHALGYVGPVSEKDLTEIDPANYRGTYYMGKIGLEKSYETILHGKTGYKHVETDAKGRLIRLLHHITPTPGADLYLSIDANLQQAAFDALSGLKGSIVALDPNTGEVLAFISKPSFDPNLFAKGIDAATYRTLQNSPDRPLFNRALRGQYPPGSTIKPLAALQGLETGAITNPDHQIFDPGFYQLNHTGRRYRDWIYFSKRHGHGWVDLNKGLAQSCDTYFFTLATRLGIKNLHHIYTTFGLGKITHLDLLGELPGLVPSAEWKKRVYRENWYPGDTLNIGIGQGSLLATPLQMAQVVATLANRGKRFLPHFVTSIDEHQGAALDKKTPIEIPSVQLKSQHYWHLVLEGMKNVVHMPGGTAYRISHGLTYQIAGKTGTAQVFNLKQNEKYEVNKIKAHLRDHSWFIAFAPIENPQIALAVLVENKYAKTGADVARVVLDNFFQQKPLPKLNAKPINLAIEGAESEDEDEVGGAHDE